MADSNAMGENNKCIAHNSQAGKSAMCFVIFILTFSQPASHQAHQEKKNSWARSANIVMNKEKAKYRTKNYASHNIDTHYILNQLEG